MIQQVIVLQRKLQTVHAEEPINETKLPVVLP